MSRSKRKIPVSRPFLFGNEKNAVFQAVESGWISGAGNFIGDFETEFSSKVGCRFGVACSNGTAAVHLALMAAGVGPNDRVVVPSFTMMASVFPIIQLGAIPVFVDADPMTWTLDPDQLKRIRAPIKAVLAVHIYGHPCEMGPLLHWATENRAIVIEDAAEAHGARYCDRPAGSLGKMACFSFYSNKVVTCGEGGMVTTNDRELAERVRLVGNLGFGSERFVHETLGYNYRMSNVLAAIGFEQTKHFDGLVDLRRKMANEYLTRLSDLSDFIQLPIEAAWAKNVYWMFGVVLKKSVAFGADELQHRLSDWGIETRRFFCPGHLQPAIANRFEGGAFPIAERLWERGLYLPSSPDLTKEEFDCVEFALREALK